MTCCRTHTCRTDSGGGRGGRVAARPSWHLLYLHNAHPVRTCTCPEASQVSTHPGPARSPEPAGQPQVRPSRQLPAHFMSSSSGQSPESNRGLGETPACRPLRAAPGALSPPRANPETEGSRRLLPTHPRPTRPTQPWGGPGSPRSAGLRRPILLLINITASRSWVSCIYYLWQTYTFITFRAQMPWLSMKILFAPLV